MRFFAVLLGLSALLAAGPVLAGSSALSVEANAAFLAANAAKPGVIVRPSGLQYRIVHNGFGKRPGPLDTVTVYYTGSLINGNVFDGTEPGLPAQMKVTEVIPGWTEALSLMREGDQWQIVIPANLAYGARGAGNGAIPPNQTLIFDLTLVAVTPYKEPPKQDDESSSGSGAY